MFSSLRTRLLLSNLLLLTVVIAVIMFAFFVATGSQPAPPQPTYQHLAGLVQGLNLMDLVVEFGPANDLDLIEQFAVARGVRVLVVDINQEQLIWDSAGHLDTQESLHLELDRDYRLSSQQRLQGRREAVYGKFTDNGEEWLFVGIASTAGQGNNPNQFALIVADIRPTQTLRNLLGEFGGALFRPIILAMGIGLIVSVVLSWMMSRTILRPLQALGNAANAVARGDLNHRVPVSGPVEMRSVADAFNTMSAEVRATQQSQRDFMANVTHDLKTPLTSIQGYSQAIIDGAAKDPSNAAAIILDEADRLNRMVTDLTELARAQAGQLHMHMEPLELGSVVRTVTQKLAVVAQGKSIDLLVEVSPVPLVVGDGDQLVQVLNNLIGNAIKYTPYGGLVQVNLTPGSGGVQIIVADSGIGIPQNELSRIFDRFYQVDKSRGPSRGTGLGLAITREIIQAHNGRISVQSIPNNGTTFTVWLPAFVPA